MAIPLLNRRARNQAQLEKKAADNARRPVPVTLTDGMIPARNIRLVPADEPERIPLADRPAPEIAPLDPARAARTAQWVAMKALAEARYLHKHTLNLAIWWAVGTARGVGMFWAWATSAGYARDAATLTRLADKAAAEGRESATTEYGKAAAQMRRAVELNRKAVWWKAALLAAGVVFLAVAAVAPGRTITGKDGEPANVGAPWWARILIAATWAGLSIREGRRTATKILELPDDDGPVTRDQIGTAFHDAGIPGVTTVGAPQYDRGRVILHVVLPPGTESREAISARNKVASALGKNRQCVSITQRPGAPENHVVVTVADRPIMDRARPSSPLTKASAWNVWAQGLPLGEDENGDPVTLPLTADGELTGWNALVFGIMRRGKSFSIMNLLVPYTLDPQADTVILEFKGDSPYEPLRHTSVKFVTSARVGIEAATRQGVDALEWLKQMVQQRQWALAAMSVDDNPKGKLTERLARTDPRFRLMIVVVDEFLNAAEASDEFTPLLDWLLRNGPSVGVTIVLGTQRATQKVMDGLRSYLPVRYCLPVVERSDSSMVLGSEHIQGVVDASALGDRTGIGYLQGSGHTRLVQTYSVDRRLLEELGGRAAPVTATDTGGDLPVSLAKTQVPLPVRVAGLFRPKDDGWVSSAELATRLGDGWDTRRIGKELRAVGVPVEMRQWRDADTGEKAGAYGVYRHHLP